MNNILIKKASKRIFSISVSLMLLLSILCGSFMGTCQAANVAKQYTIAAWQFTDVVKDDSFWSTHGIFVNRAYIVALENRPITTSKVSIDGSAFLGTIYCGDWGYGGDRWRIYTPTAGYKNISLSFASYGVMGAPQNFRVETKTGEVLARFASGVANKAGYFTRVDISLPSYCNNRQYIVIDIIREDNTSIGGGPVQSGLNSNSRLGDIIVSGEKVDEAVHGSVIAAWEFTNIVSNDSFQATDGPLAHSANILAQTGRTATTSRVSVTNRRYSGTIYSGGWNNGGCWEIDFSTKGYKYITLSFASYGVAGAPCNFRVEDATGNVLTRFTSGTSAANATYLDLMLPSHFENGDGSVYIYMDGTASIGGGTVQSGDASNSRLGDIVISGIKLPNETAVEIEPYELSFSIQKDKQSILAIRGSGVSSPGRVMLEVSYDPAVLEPIDLCEFSWEYELCTGVIVGSGITIDVFRPGQVVFTVDKSVLADTEWSGIFNAIRFRAKLTGDTTIAVQAF
jgi:hypothetical protein